MNNQCTVNQNEDNMFQFQFDPSMNLYLYFPRIMIYLYCNYYNIYYTIFLDDLPVAPGMSNKLKINQNDQNTSINICAIDTTVEHEWTEDVGGFWDDEVPEIISQPDTTPEPISEDEINHIKVISSIL